MLDNGYPLITEPNALTSMVAPPNLAGRVLNYVTVRAAVAVLRRAPWLMALRRWRMLTQGKSSISENVDAGALSIIPWRTSKVSYTQVRWWCVRE